MEASMQVGRRAHLRKAALCAALGLTWLLFGVTAADASQAQAKPTAADKSLAHKELLPRTAYPSNLKRQGKSSTDPDASFWGGDDKGDEQTMAACLGVSTKNVVTNPAQAADQTYADPNSDFGVADTVEVYPRESQAVADVVDSDMAKTPGCIMTLEGSVIVSGTLQSFGSGAKSAGALAVSSRAIPGVGDHTSFMQLALPVTYQGETGTTYTDFVAVQEGRSESSFLFLNDGVPPSTSLIDRLAKAAAARMKNS
jgi:hypothetical protein